MLLKNSFNQTIDGKQTELFFLKNKNQVEIALCNYGARIVNISVPDKNGVLTNIVDGYDSIDKYRASACRYHGATIGRYANRVANGLFFLENIPYKLPINNPPNSLHGGNGFHEVVWDAHQIDDQSVEFSYLSKDMEEGFPGNLQVKIIMSLTEKNELSIEYTASTDKLTIINLTNHSFFNLNGIYSETILNHIVKIHADTFTPVDQTLIPTGEIKLVQGTPFDFRIAKRIGSRIDDVGIDDDQQLKFARGYDHNFILNTQSSINLNHAATVTGDLSGIVMQIFTTEPAIQFYSGEHRKAFAMETQHFPDSPNQPSFPKTELRPGEKFKSLTLYKFLLKKE